MQRNNGEEIMASPTSIVIHLVHNDFLSRMFKAKRMYCVCLHFIHLSIVLLFVFGLIVSSFLGIQMYSSHFLNLFCLDRRRIDKWLVLFFDLAFTQRISVTLFFP